MKTVLKIFLCLVFLSVLAYDSLAMEIEVTISKNIDRKIRITALPIFSEKISAKLLREIYSVIKFDLRYCGYFELWPKKRLPKEASERYKKYQQMDYDFWINYGTEMLLKGAVCEKDRDLTINLYFYDIASQEIFIELYAEGDKSDLRGMVHKLTGKLIEKISGRPSITTTKIAYVCQQRDAKNIFYMDYDGKNKRQLTFGDYLNLSPSWDKSTDSILFMSYMQNYPFIYEKNIHTKEIKLLSGKPGLNAFPSVSPDGEKIALTLSISGNPEIYIIDRNGEIITRVTYNKAVDNSPVWSPDGQKIAFVSDRTGTPQIYVADLMRKTAKRITYRGNYNTSPDWSPIKNSPYIVYSSLYGKNSELCIVNANTGKTRRLTTTLESEEDPFWAPDGIHVSYTLTQNFKSDIYFMDVRDKSSVKLTGGKNNYSSSSWRQ